MKSVIKKHMQWLAVGLAFAAFQLSGQVNVSFKTAGITVGETDSVTVTIKLSEASLLDVEVPYVIASASTAVRDQDFEIPEETDDFDNESPILFGPGETSKTITINIINDDTVEDDEFIYIDLVSDGLTVAELGDITRYTIRIVDNNKDLRVYFKTHEDEVSESENVTIPFYLSAPSESEIEVGFSITMLTVDNDDIDLTDTFTTGTPYKFASNSTIGSINVKVNNDSITDRNAGGADRETFQVQLTSAVFSETREAIDFDPTPCIVTIVDNDPLTAEFYIDEDAVSPFEIEEYQSVSVTVTLVGPDGEASSADDYIDIPISFAGGAIRGDGDDDDYDVADSDFDPDKNTLRIPIGNSSVTMDIDINNDDNIEDDELVELTMGTPVYEDGGDIQTGENDRISFVIHDNDPVTVSFGAVYSKDDKEAAENEDIDDIVFVPSAGSFVGESWGTINIPIFLSSPSGNNVEFDLEIVGDGTTATLFDPGIDSDAQDWDYSISSPTNLSKVDNATNLTIRAGLSSGYISIVLNNDEESPVVYGETPPDDVEPDETIRFRISNVNTDSSHVSMGEESTYNLVIKDLPDIDITNLVTGLSPDPAGLVNGGPRFNDLTSLFDVEYHMSLATPLDPNEFHGYRSLKAQYRTSNYDASNPDSENNDPLVQNPTNPKEGAEFHFFVSTPYQVRYPSGSKWITLHEGAEPVDDFYDVTTADTYEVAPYILRPLNLPRLNDFEADIEGAFDLNETMDWTVNFYSTGFFTMPLDRVDPTSNPERLKIFLTAEGTEVYGANGTTLTIEKFIPQPDGSMYLIIDTYGAQSIQLQYLDIGDNWKIVQPAQINTGGASKVYWVDEGPPQTQSHPSTVNFRLYRAIQL